MSDTNGLPNTDAQGVPAEDDPERFERGPNEQGSDEQGSSAPAADRDEPGAEAPPADFDPAEQPSNPDLVSDEEPPDT